MKVITCIFLLAMVAVAVHGKVSKTHLTNVQKNKIHIGSTAIETGDEKHWSCLTINDLSEYIDICDNATIGVFERKNHATTILKRDILHRSLRTETNDRGFKLESVEIRFGGNVSDDDTDHVEKIIIKKKEELPVHLLADLVIHQLNVDIYRHLFWTYNFDRFNNFFPNVGAHMRKRRDMLTKRRDMIAEYILKKHATTHHTEGGAPTNYAQSLYDASAKAIEFDTDYLKEDFNTLSISDALTRARKAEIEIISMLTEILYKADDVGDHEVGEFITGDVMPDILKSVKSLENDIQILNAMITSTTAQAASTTTTAQAASTASGSRTPSTVIEHLAEYLFDKTNY